MKYIESILTLNLHYIWENEMTMKSDIHQKHESFQKSNPEQTSKAQVIPVPDNCAKASVK